MVLEAVGGLQIIQFQRTIKLLCCDWLQETIKYEPVDSSELAKLK